MRRYLRPLRTIATGVITATLLGTVGLGNVDLVANIGVAASAAELTTTTTLSSERQPLQVRVPGGASRKIEIPPELIDSGLIESGLIDSADSPISRSGRSPLRMR